MSGYRCPRSLILAIELWRYHRYLARFKQGGTATEQVDSIDSFYQLTRHSKIDSLPNVTFRVVDLSLNLSQSLLHILHLYCKSHRFRANAFARWKDLGALRMVVIDGIME